MYVQTLESEVISILTLAPVEQKNRVLLPDLRETPARFGTFDELLTFYNENTGS